MAAVLLVVLTPLIWIALRGDFGPSGWLVTGSVALLMFARHRRAPPRKPRGAISRRALAAVHVAGLFAYELVISNVQQLRVVFGPARLCKPHWLHFRTELEDPALRAMLGVLISLTPGTLTCEIDRDGIVWVHLLVAEDEDAAVARLRRLLEAPLRRLET